jgi:hypothetical protein
MRLANAMGMPWEEQFEDGSPEHSEFIELLREVTCDFMRAGGKITLTEWSGFTPLEREIAKDAGDMIRATDAAMSGVAAQGQHARILSIADDGQALISERLSEMLDRAEGKETDFTGVSL